MNSLLYLLLSASPVAAQPAPTVPPVPTTTDPMTAIYLLVGAFVLKELLSFGRDFIKGLATRTVEREDKDKEDLKKRLEEHDDRFEETDRSVAAIDKTVGAVQLEMKQVLSTVEATRGMVIEIKGAMDNRFEKQAEFYRTQIKELLQGVDKRLEDLEFKLRQDMSRAVHDASMMSRPRNNKKL